MAEKEGQSLEVGGREVPCPVCGHDRFWKRKSLMNTRGATFFGLDWADQAATNYVCGECGHVLWFLNRK
jgi:DNA-directed RNA polymerase subunit RPC12/RpoP